MNAYALDESGRCAACRQELAGFDAAYCFGSYERPLQDLIQLFKYGKVESLAAPLSQMLIEALPLEERFDAVVAMPMHWRKRWERGFNQAELLAHPVARHLGLKPATNLRRCRHTEAQAGLSDSERQRNLKDAFEVRAAEQLAGKRILLIDDVFTTGATLRAAAKALKSAGAAHVSALTLARVDRRASNLDFAPGVSRPLLAATSVTEAS